MISPTIHPYVLIHASATIGSGATIFARVSIGGGAIIGAFSVIWKDAIIGDGAIIGESANIGAGAIIGEGADICARANIGDHVMHTAFDISGHDGECGWSSGTRNGVRVMTYGCETHQLAGWPHEELAATHAPSTRFDSVIRTLLVARRIQEHHTQGGAS